MNPKAERTQDLRPNELRFTYSVEHDGETRNGFVRAYNSSQAKARVWNFIGYYAHGAVITVEQVQA